jgi:DNA replication licensing factor MCM5
MDRQSVYSTRTYNPTYDEAGDTRLQIRTDLEEFILGFRIDNNYIYRLLQPLLCVYTCIISANNSYHRDQLRENALLKKYYCDVNIGDLISYNEELAHRLASEPADMIPLVSICYRLSLFQAAADAHSSLSLP